MFARSRHWWRARPIFAPGLKRTCLARLSEFDGYGSKERQSVKASVFRVEIGGAGLRARGVVAGLADKESSSTRDALRSSQASPAISPALRPSLLLRAWATKSARGLPPARPCLPEYGRRRAGERLRKRLVEQAAWPPWVAHEPIRFERWY